MEKDRIEASLFGSPELSMSFDYFAKLFTKRGKSTIVEYPS